MANQQSLHVRGISVSPRADLSNSPPLQQAVPSLLEVKQRNLRVCPQAPEEEGTSGRGKECPGERSGQTRSASTVG